MKMRTEEQTEEIHDEIESYNATEVPKLAKYRIPVPSTQANLRNERSRTGRFLDFLKFGWVTQIRIPSALTRFRRKVQEKEELSVSIASPVGIRRRFHIHFIRKINWASLFCMLIDWLKNPMNIALVLWFICVSVAGTMLGLLMMGLLNQAFPSRASRNYWIEINNQILNSLCTLMSICQHPILFHHLVMLCRWRSDDIIELREIYCKNRAYRPREWLHITVVVVLLHVTCFAQYALCGLYWGYSITDRPVFLDDLFLAIGVTAPVIAGLYAVGSPLGKEYSLDFDEESQTCSSKSAESNTDKYHRVIVSKPEWIGGLFDCWKDRTVCYLSFFCSFCVFGWNMERLGFGNMYVHIFTFILLCVAPLWILGISALKINNAVIADTIGIIGMVLCFFGLLYGGHWRIQMRKRFKLPKDKFCCGSPSMSDYVKWLFCWPCSLAQEVRTANVYDVDDDSVYRRLLTGDEESTSPLPTTSSSVSSLCYSKIEGENISGAVIDVMMDAPCPPIIQMKHEVSDEHYVPEKATHCDNFVLLPDSELTEDANEVSEGHYVLLPSNTPVTWHGNAVTDGDDTETSANSSQITSEEKYSECSGRMRKFALYVLLSLVIMSTR